ncbi:hypothetical protein [Sphingomonas sp.]|uniref:hypothetical protein n=1 Tax=Sphingomonas sp. TaxID=28214 RepID=UPI0026014773|nr:hypothetical protein [Sphingomonas sp.]MBV9527336.1 hypothetical protein [Sphingomonas sp.]
MRTHLRAIHVQGVDFWLARASVAAIAGLQLLMINDLTVGPRWFAPVLELALLVPLSVATAGRRQMFAPPPQMRTGSESTATGR